MNRLMRHAVTFAAGGLTGAVIIAGAPAAFAASPAAEPGPRADMTASSTQPAPPAAPRTGSALSPDEGNRMIDQCGQIMRNPQMRQMMTTYMSGDAAMSGSPMMGGSGGSMMGGTSTSSSLMSGSGGSMMGGTSH